MGRALLPESRGSLLSARGISKQFPGVRALKNVTFDLFAGEVHALCGENGAGKSTLIKILSGAHPFGSYEGRLEIDSQEARFGGIADAERAGLSVLYQELALVPEMSVAENIFLGAEPIEKGLIHWRRIYQEAGRLLEMFDLDIDPAEKVSKLGAGRQQMVEIAKAFRKKARILILDEPTAALSEKETKKLFSMVLSLKKRGVACIYISHRLEEVFEIADRITVLRDGESVASFAAKETDKKTLIRSMVGREIKELFPRKRRGPGKTILEVKGLTVSGPENDEPVLEDVSFELKAGEVLGIGGLMGAGRTELLTHLFGLWGRRVRGDVLVSGKKSDLFSPKDAFRLGLALVSEDRRKYGLILRNGIGFNLSLSSLSGLTHRGLIDSHAEFRENQRQMSSLRIKAPHLASFVQNLSGGNQQKVVLGRVLMTGPSVIFLDEPTRGVDVGAKVEIYEIINQLTDAGKGVVLASSELPELMGMSDRIVMLHEGRVAGEFDVASATQEELLSSAMGAEASARAGR